MGDEEREKRGTDNERRLVPSLCREYKSVRVFVCVYERKRENGRVARVCFNYLNHSTCRFGRFGHLFDGFLFGAICIHSTRPSPLG